MLILVAGITGMVGRPCAAAALKAGHAVRGMGRNLDKVEKSIADQLESFVTISSIYDLAALNRAVQGVDAIISAYTYVPEVYIEGQLLLLRAAERAGIKIFHCSSWNYDWTKGYYGHHELYDDFLLFHHHIRISSSIKPLYMFTGAITEWVFNSPRDNPLNRDAKTLSYFGNGNELCKFSTTDDLAAYTVAAVSAPGAENGGFIYVQSFTTSPLEIASTYEEVTGVKLTRKRLGSLEDVQNLLAEQRHSTPPTDFDKYLGLAYAEHTLKGTWEYEPVDCESSKTSNKPASRSGLSSIQRSCRSIRIFI